MIKNLLTKSKQCVMMHLLGKEWNPSLGSLLTCPEANLCLQEETCPVEKGNYFLCNVRVVSSTVLKSAFALFLFKKSLTKQQKNGNITYRERLKRFPWMELLFLFKSIFCRKTAVRWAGRSHSITHAKIDLQQFFNGFKQLLIIFERRNYLRFFYIKKRTF